MEVTTYKLLPFIVSAAIVSLVSSIVRNLYNLKFEV